MGRRVVLATVAAMLAGCAGSPPAAPASTSVVFFTADSAGLDDPAKAAIDAAASRAKTTSEIVHVRGFAAPDTGTAEFNRALAQARAQAVADGLVADGVPASRVRIESRGAVPYALMPTEARRVEIAVGG